MRRRVITAVLCISLALLCGSPAPAPREAKSEPVTAILGAFEKEVALLEYQLKGLEEKTIEGMRFACGRLHGKRVVTAWTGVGKVNAAMTATLLIEHYKPRAVIVTGIAGGVNPELSPGDIVIAEKTAYHDCGTAWPEGVTYKGVKNPFTGWENPVFFEADERLLKSALQTAEKVELKALKTSEGQRTPRIVKGVIVTGDLFIASEAKGAELRKEFGADAVDMESAAVAQICYQRDIPVLVIRSISDKADEKAREDIGMFHLMAARNSSTFVGRMVELTDSGFPVERQRRKP